MKPVYETVLMEIKQLIKLKAGTMCQYIPIYPIPANIFIFNIHQIVFSSTLLTMMWIYYIEMRPVTKTVCALRQNKCV